MAVATLEMSQSDLRTKWRSTVRSHLALDLDLRSAGLLDRVLAPDPAIYRWVSANSRPVFANIDHWLGLRTTSVLRIAASVTARGMEVRRPDPSEHPLAALLVQPHALEDGGIADALTALVVVGVMTGRGEATLVADLCNGIRLSMGDRAVAWHAVLPKSGTTPSPDLAGWIKQCRRHATAARPHRDGRLTVQSKWLLALVRWCDLLIADADAADFIGLAPTVRLGLPVEGDVPENRDLEVDYVPVDVLPEDEVVDSVDNDQSCLDGNRPDVDLGPEDLPEATDQAVLAFPPSGAPDDNYPEPPDEADARAAKTGFKAARQNQWLPYLHEAMSPEEACELTAWIRSALASPARATQVAGGLLGLIEATGLPLELVLSLPIAEASINSSLTHDGVWRRKILREPNAWTAQLAQMPLLRRWTNRVSLALPSEIRAWLSAVARGQPHISLAHALRINLTTAERIVREALQTVRQQSDGYQTMGRVQHWLMTAAYQVSQDHVAAHLVAAPPSDAPQPAAYYRAYPISQLADVHRQALERAGWTFDAAPAQLNDPELWAGSQLNPEPDGIRQLWREARSALKTLVDDASKPFHERFNAHQLLSAMQLTFIGGIRCVRDPVESLFDFSILDRLGVIDDKNQNEDRAHRLIALAEVFAEQLDYQTDHLARCITRVRPLDVRLAERIRLALQNPKSRTLPLFFLLDKDLRARSIQPKDFKRAFGEYWPLPFNLGRHYLATECIQRDVGDLPTASFLGHVGVGTQNLSILSPLAPSGLFAELKQSLNDIAKELGLEAPPTFLTEEPADLHRPLLPKGKRPGKLIFGRQARALARSRALNRVRLEASQWVTSQLNSRTASELTQEDVDKLFDLARTASPNARTYTAVTRFEQLRSRLEDIVREHELNIELPAVAIPVHDQAIVCPLEAPQATAWVRTLRSGVRQAWASAFANWRSSRGEREEHDLPLIVLTIILECAAFDPSIWLEGGGADPSAKLSRRGEPALVRQARRYFVRFDVGGDNSRLYPTPRVLALILGRMPLCDLFAVDHSRVVALARDLTADSAVEAPADFRSLLAQVRSGMAMQAPGLVLGYADGGHASVSPGDACLERAGGQTPRVDTLARWRAKVDAGRHERTVSLAEAIRGAEAEIDRQGLLDKCVGEADETSPDIGRFFRSVSKAFKAGARRKGRGKRSAPVEFDALIDKPEGDHDATLRRRFIAVLQDEFAALSASGARLPATCAQVGDWLLGLAEDGYGSGQYVVKSLRNVWSSWGRLLARHSAGYKLEKLEAAELVSVYTDVISASKANKRAHLFPLIRSFHRYLMDQHGACGIDWTTILRACGVGIARVDANVVHDHEYQEALRLLYYDKHVGGVRRARLNAACLVLLYRGGLRIDEVTGLRSSDLVHRSGRWFIRVGRNIYRGVKSDAGVRLVPILEALTAFEEEVLADWREHVDGFLDHRKLYPLFTAEQNSAERISLRDVSQRLVQALRHVTGDPFIRVHHCRHAWATRILKWLMSHPSPDPATDAAAGAVGLEDPADGVRRLITGSSDRTRRVLWAIAEILGHGSPLQSLHSYAHGGHELLDEWLGQHWWSDAPLIQPLQGADPAEVELFACGVARRSWMRRLERAAASKKSAPMFDAEAGMDSVIDVDHGDRVSRGPRLGPMRVRASGRSPRLFDIDRIVDHGRQFGHLRGLSESLFVPPAWVQAVMEQARSVCLESRGPSPEGLAAPWWLDGGGVYYSAHERRQLRAAYRRLERIPPSGPGNSVETIVPLFEFSSGIFVVSSPDDLRRAVQALECITGTRDAIEVLIPAVKTDGTSPTSLKKDGRRRAGKLKTMKGVKKPRVESYVPQYGEEVWAPWCSLAAELRVVHRLHGDVPERRDGGRNAFERGLRVGVRVKENSKWTVRSAKVGARAFAIWAVGARMRDMTTSPM